jgi:hypothetical protein
MIRLLAQEHICKWFVQIQHIPLRYAVARKLDNSDLLMSGQRSWYLSLVLEPSVPLASSHVGRLFLCWNDLLVCMHVLLGLHVLLHLYDLVAQIVQQINDLRRQLLPV